MKARIVKVGNSRGLRIPKHMLALYHLNEGVVVKLEERREGTLLRPDHTQEKKVSWEEAYREMAAEANETAEWAAWDTLSGDGLED